MDHQNIARVHDAGTTEGGRPYFVMELVHGVPITEYCDANKLTPRQRLELFVPVCHAIQHAHQKGIIHRDIKPSNILVTMYDDKPVPKVIDFGVAKAVEQRLTEKTVYTQFGTLVGTFEYMSPEQAEMNAFGVDTRSDIYALGVLLYELLTGTTPLERSQLREAAFGEIVRRIKEEDPPRPSVRLSSSGSLAKVAAERKTDAGKLSRLVRGELDWVVMRCLEKDRTRRYDTASGLARDVERYLRDEPVDARPPSVLYRMHKLVRRHRRAAMVGAALLMLVVVMLVNHFVGYFRLKEARGRAHAEANRARIAAADAAAERDRALTAQKEAEEARQAEFVHRMALEATALEKTRLAANETMALNKAKEQAAIAQAVLDFLQHDLLRQADMGQQPGGDVPRDPNVKVRTLLDRAAKTLDGKFAEQPQIEAVLRLTIGDAYGALGQLTEARPQLERAVQLDAGALGAEHYSTLHDKTRLALLMAAQGEHDNAERLLNEVLEARTAQHGRQHPDTLQTLKDLAKLAVKLDQLDQAEKLLQEASAGYIALGWHADHPARLECKYWLGVVWYERGELERAEALLQEVVNARLSKRGKDDPETLHSMVTLATVYLAGRKFAQAEPLFLEVLHAFKATCEADDPMLLKTQHNVAALYYLQGKYAEAEPLFRAAAEGMRRKRGLAHPDAEKAIQSWFMSCERANRLAQAEPLARELLAVWKERTGTESNEYGLHMGVLGRVLLAAGKSAEAEHVLRECLVLGERLKADPAEMAIVQSLLGGALLAQQKFADAEPYLLQGYEELVPHEANLPAELRFRVTETLDRLARLYVLWGKKDQAARWHKELEARQEADMSLSKQ
jgi:hypothetical protein